MLIRHLRYKGLPDVMKEYILNTVHLGRGAVDIRKLFGGSVWIGENGGLQTVKKAERGRRA